MYAYPDINFSGMYGHKEPTDSSCVNGCTRFIITFSDFPVLWVSKLQTETVISAMEAEIIAMSH